MSDRNEVEIEVPGTPEQVWEAIATGPGISAWFMPAEVDPDAMTITHNHGPDMSGTGKITAYEPPHRFGFDDEGGATEFLVEAKSGGTCVVRIVFSGFEGAEEGWTAALRALRLYLEHFPGQEAAVIVAGGVVEGPAARAWAELLAALGLGEPAEGERVTAAGPGVPPLAGVVTDRDDTMATILIDDPAPGIAFVGVGGPSEDQVFAFVRAQYFGDTREEVVARDDAAWRALLEEKLAMAR